jgi:hypothetical protein
MADADLGAAKTTLDARPSEEEETPFHSAEHFFDFLMTTASRFG